MRILKYLLLLFFLVLIGLTVFVATQKGTYEVSQTRTIKIPKNVVYSYVSDMKNWPSFLSGNSDFTYSFPAITSGKGGSYSWDSPDGSGKTTIMYAKPSDSLALKMDYDGNLSRMSWKFTAAPGNATTVQWTGKGRMGFFYKVRAIWNGGISSLLSAVYEESLAKLDKTLKEEISNYTISPVTMADLPKVRYLKQSITSHITDSQDNIRILVSRMQYYFKKNGLKRSGVPFVRYEKYDGPNNLCRFSVCFPIAQEVFITEGSDVQYGEMPKLRAVKISLKGDVSHLSETRTKAKAYIQEKQLEILGKYRWIEVYSVSSLDIARPSQWRTDLYYPTGTYLEEAPVTETTATEAVSTTGDATSDAPVSSPAQEDATSD